MREKLGWGARARTYTRTYIYTHTKPHTVSVGILNRLILVEGSNLGERRRRREGRKAGLGDKERSKRRDGLKTK